MKNQVALVQQQFINNGSQTLEFALSSLENVLFSSNIGKVALSSDDDLFKLIPINIFKKITNKNVRHVQIIISNPTKFISDTKKIDQIRRSRYIGQFYGTVHSMYLLRPFNHIISKQTVFTK